jgi:hypothetical protein
MTSQVFYCGPASGRSSIRKDTSPHRRRLAGGERNGRRSIQRDASICSFNGSPLATTPCY